MRSDAGQITFTMDCHEACPRFVPRIGGMVETTTYSLHLGDKTLTDQAATCRWPILEGLYPPDFPLRQFCAKDANRIGDLRKRVEYTYTPGRDNIYMSQRTEYLDDPGQCPGRKATPSRGPGGKSSAGKAK